MKRNANAKEVRENLEQLAAMFRAFSDPTRLHLLQELLDGEKNVTELVEKLELSQSNISKHLQVLHAAKLIGKSKRGTSSYYKVSDTLVNELCTLICNKINSDQKSRSESSDLVWAPDYSI